MRPDVSTEQNYLNHLASTATLTGLEIAHEVVVGQYNGKQELSIVVGMEHRHVALLLATYHKQESILMLVDNQGMLLTADGNLMLSLGTWTEVDSNTSDDYTEIDGKKYTCKRSAQEARTA